MTWYQRVTPVPSTKGFRFMVKLEKKEKPFLFGGTTLVLVSYFCLLTNGMGSSESRSNAVRIQSEMVAEVFTNVATNCQGIQQSSQIIALDCRPREIDGRSYESNPACLRCMDNVLKEREAYYQRVRAVWANSDEPDIALSINDDYAGTVDAMRACTTHSCKACVFENISQNVVMTGLTNCQSLTNIKNQLTQELSTKVTQTLTNQSDLLGPLVRLFGIGSSSQDMVQNITNRIAVQLTSSVISDVVNAMNSNQFIEINTGSGVFNGQTQDGVYSNTVNYFIENNILNNTFTEVELEIMAEVENRENTIGALGELIPATVETLTRAANSILGAVMYFVIALTGLVALGIICVIVYRWVQRHRPWEWFQRGSSLPVSSNVATYGNVTF
jgi:hypothetical protein